MTHNELSSDPNLARKLRIAHWCANLSYAALLVVLTVWAVGGAGFSPILWAVVCVPLLILWPGMRKRRHRAYSWLCFVILFYFVKSVEGSLSSVANWIDYSVLALSVIIFISAMLTSRWLQRANFAASQTNSHQEAAAASPAQADSSHSELQRKKNEDKELS